MLSMGWVGCTWGWVQRIGVLIHPVFPAAHKQAWKSKSPQQPVQHEIHLCPAPQTCGQPQPRLLVSRSQSPLPPVTWGSRVPSGPHSPATPSLGDSPRREPARPQRVPLGR